MSTEDTKLIDQKQLAAMLGIKTKALGRWVAAGKVPLPIVTAGDRKYWSPSQITEWLSASGISQQQESIEGH
jgi:predicted DNA-binding transcriptional regulator AlpA